ncbi:MAG: hypothetical protein GPJ54_15425 [Candidatus Heimdallarchaeota archaeon]|nr:hypothetical protein [Candidatus Heimdallarchaeota archaeon]
MITLFADIYLSSRLQNLEEYSVDSVSRTSTVIVVTDISDPYYLVIDNKKQPSQDRVISGHINYASDGGNAYPTEFTVRVPENGKSFIQINLLKISSSMSISFYLNSVFRDEVSVYFITSEVFQSYEMANEWMKIRNNMIYTLVGILFAISFFSVKSMKKTQDDILGEQDLYPTWEFV